MTGKERKQNDRDRFEMSGDSPCGCTERDQRELNHAAGMP